VLVKKDSLELSEWPQRIGWIRNRFATKNEALEISHAGAFGSRIWVDRERNLLGVIFTPIPLNHAKEIHKQIRNKIRLIFPASNQKPTPKGKN
jgi:hypothetical protein